MHLSEILRELTVTTQSQGSDPEIVGVTCNSRQVRQGFLFVAIPGITADGWEYVNNAIRRGAAAIVSEHALRKMECACQVMVDDAHVAFAEIASAFNGHPSRKLKVVGITGTNGKTTTAYMTRSVLRSAGMEPGLLGTVAYEIGERTIAASRTTPDAATTQDFLKQMVDIGCRAAVMEVSSHALVQKRTVGIDYDVGIFTNLTRDHLDYHKTMDAYFEAKALLFKALAPRATAVINVDDAWGVRLHAEGLPSSVLTYGVENAGADVSAESIHVDIKGCRFLTKTPWGDHAVKMKLLGRHNVSNALACIAACGSLGVSLESIASALSKLETVRGRLELVRGRHLFSVFIDYAHTDDALAHALMTVRELTTGRVIVVFGCGGDRDKTKRPVMGEVAARLADVVVVTSDNPRNEEPLAIIESVQTGIGKDAPATVMAIEDRAEAIRMAVDMAEAGDVVLIAGKGHETYQESGSRTIAFDDHDVAQDALKARGKTVVAKPGKDDA